MPAIQQWPIEHRLLRLDESSETFADGLYQILLSKRPFTATTTTHDRDNRESPLYPPSKRKPVAISSHQTTKEETRILPQIEASEERQHIEKIGFNQAELDTISETLDHERLTHKATNSFEQFKFIGHKPKGLATTSDDKTVEQDISNKGPSRNDCASNNSSEIIHGNENSKLGTVETENQVTKNESNVHDPNSIDHDDDVHVEQVMEAAESLESLRVKVAVPAEHTPEKLATKDEPTKDARHPSHTRDNKIPQAVSPVRPEPQRLGSSSKELARYMTCIIENGAADISDNHPSEVLKTRIETASYHSINGNNPVRSN